MKRIALALAIIVGLTASVEAGFVRNILGRGKSAAGKVLRKASHPFGNCANGACR